MRSLLALTVAALLQVSFAWGPWGGWNAGPPVGPAPAWPPGNSCKGPYEKPKAEAPKPALVLVVGGGNVEDSKKEGKGLMEALAASGSKGKANTSKYSTTEGLDAYKASVGTKSENQKGRGKGNAEAVAASFSQVGSKASAEGNADNLKHLAHAKGTADSKASAKGESELSVKEINEKSKQTAQGSAHAKIDSKSERSGKSKESAQAKGEVHAKGESEASGGSLAESKVQVGSKAQSIVGSKDKQTAESGSIAAATAGATVNSGHGKEGTGQAAVEAGAKGSAGSGSASSSAAVDVTL